MTQEDKEKLQLVLEDNTYMSSAESGQETDSEDGSCKVKYFSVRRITWRSNYLNNWFKMLDGYADKRGKCKGQLLLFRGVLVSPVAELWLKLRHSRH